MVDAGHGGKDPGNRGNGYFEKNIALNIALNVGEILTQIRLKLFTQEPKMFLLTCTSELKLQTMLMLIYLFQYIVMPTILNAYGAGTFVLGLHANERNFKIAQKENSVIYLEENYEQKYDGFDPNNPESVISLVLMQEEYLDQSIVAANYIQEFFVKDLNRRDRKVKQAGFLVLRNTYMPSVLIEAGFLTNKTEGQYLNSSKGQKEISTAISRAILKYLSSLDNNLVNLTDPFKFNGKGEFLFKVQISASSKSLELKSYNFKGLNNLSKSNNNGLYKYYYGGTNDYNEVKKLLKNAKSKGFNSAFIAVFKEGQPYSLKKYLDEFE